jgi:hypothetical protein
MSIARATSRGDLDRHRPGLTETFISIEIVEIMIKYFPTDVLI